MRHNHPRCLNSCIIENSDDSPSNNCNPHLNAPISFSDFKIYIIVDTKIVTTINIYLNRFIKEKILNSGYKKI